MKAAFVFVLVFGSGLISNSFAGSADIHCESIRRTDSSTGKTLRGVSVWHELHYQNESGSSIAFEKRSKHTVWFGTDQLLRDQAGSYCQWVARTHECSPDGQTRTSYARGGVSNTSTEWRLHAPNRRSETFSDGAFAWSDSAFEQCYDRIIEIAVSGLENFSSH